MFKIGDATTFFPTDSRLPHSVDDALSLARCIQQEATTKELDLLRDALRQAEARELAALAELDEANAMLRKFSWSQFRLDEAKAKLREFAWQPIETAPRDRPILLYRPGAVGDRRVSPGGWNGCRYHSNPRPYWDCFVANTDTRWCRDFPPTHWMDLPEPPTEVTPCR